MTVVTSSHEEGRWESSGFVLMPVGHVFLRPSEPCRHPSLRTLESDFGSLGAGWAFSIQPVLPPDDRPPLLCKM